MNPRAAVLAVAGCMLAMIGCALAACNVSAWFGLGMPIVPLTTAALLIRFERPAAIPPLPGEL